MVAFAHPATGDTGGLQLAPRHEPASNSPGWGQVAVRYSAGYGVLLRTSGVPRDWQPARTWLVGALCIHRHEGAWNANTGNGYYGGMQFLLGTWRSVGGTGLPHRATPREQIYRAWLVWKRDGGSWREWGTRGACRLG